jgi:DNA-binding transcriptional regulator YhcF (GntR family)
VLEIAFRPDSRSPQPVYRQLAGCLRDWIETGRLPVGERLPATRDLARGLGLSRNTVQQAYLALTDLGMVDASVGRGTFVAPLPATRPRAPARRTARRLPPTAIRAAGRRSALRSPAAWSRVASPVGPATSRSSAARSRRST